MSKLRPWKKELLWCFTLVIATIAWSTVTEKTVSAGDRQCYYDEFFNDCYFLEPLTCLCDI